MCDLFVFAVVCASFTVVFAEFYRHVCELYRRVCEFYRRVCGVVTLCVRVIPSCLWSYNVVYVDVFMIGCGDFPTIEQWNFNRYNAPPPPTRELFRKGAIERTMRYPTITISEDV